MSHASGVTVEGIIERIDAWRGRPVSIRAPDERTHQRELPCRRGRPGVRRADPGRVHRAPGDRPRERAPQRRVAAALGIGPAILHHFPDSEATVAEFLHGRPMSNDSLQEPGMPARIAATLRVLHGGPRFLRDFDMPSLAERYRALAERRGYGLPAGYRARRAAIDRISAALAGRPRRHGAVPQRPPGRQLHRAGRAAPPGGLGVQRQRRPDVRAREHVSRAGLRRRPGDGSSARRTSAARLHLSSGASGST